MLLPTATDFGFGDLAASSFTYNNGRGRCRINPRVLATHGRHHREHNVRGITDRCNPRLVHSSGTRTCSHLNESMPYVAGDHDGESRTLSEMMKESYRYGETDGVQDALKSNSILATLTTQHDANIVASLLIGAAIDAAGKDRGCLAGIINSLLASCCGDDEEDADDIHERHSSSVHPEISLAILNLVDEMHSEDSASMVTPDIVSLSLVYYALVNPTHIRGDSQDVKFASQSRAILDRARRMAKKTAGSQRRRALASERRRGGNRGDSDTMIDARRTECDLQMLCGSDIRVLHETSDAIVISKPAGMVCYHAKQTGAGKITPSRRKKIRSTQDIATDPDTGDIVIDGGAMRVDISLVDALLDCSIALSTLNPAARGVVHRLDRGTSGCLVLAKTDDMHLRLVALFFLRRSEKKYFALVPGRSTNHGSASDVVGGEDDGSRIWRRNLPLSLGSSGVIDAPVDGRPARSSYRVTRVFGKEEQTSSLSSSSSEALLLEVATLTGRKHQVRVHCASLGYPIFLDPLYALASIPGRSASRAGGKTKRWSPSAVITHGIAGPSLPRAIVYAAEMSKFQERFFLHSAHLSIREVGISANAPLPQWWLDTMDQLN
jgi:23S rRNA-/tRNA-specific pseudouridylate synthase